MPDMMQDIRAFHEKFGLAYDGGPRVLPPELRKLRVDRLNEESSEYEGATIDFDGEAMLDALVDTVYIALGNAYLHGYDFNEAWRRVHEANMRKVRATHADHSRHGTALDIVKPEGWTPPDLSDLV